MKPFFLPNTYKKIGWVLLLPSFVVGFVIIILGYPFINEPSINVYGFFGNEFRRGQIMVLPNLTSILFLIGGILVMFSKEKKEDEYINQIRLSSFQFSVFVNYTLLLISMFFIHGIPFFHVMVYNLFTIIIIYILRFQYLIFDNSISKNE